MNENFLENLEINELFKDEESIKNLRDAAYASVLAVDKQIVVLERNRAFYKKVVVLTEALLKKAEAVRRFVNR